MNAIGERISKYVSEHGDAPSSRHQLPVLPNRDSTNLDGWGRPIDVSFTGDTLTLTSFGADGRAGGISEDKDYVATMRVIGGQAAWVTSPEL